MKRIVWLASYPKSGNTWVRFLLANYLGNGSPVAVNQLGLGRLAGSRPLFDEWSCVEASDLTDEEVEERRADVYRAVARAASRRLYLKVHDAWTTDRGGQPLFPADVTAGAVYIVRNPLDIAVSYARHFDEDVRRVVDVMCAENPVLTTASRALQLPQRLLSWSAHVHSWTKSSGLGPVLIRFEDLLLAPAATFARLCRGIGLAVDHGRVCDAVQASAFDRLQAQERAVGFPERLSRRTPFFRIGVAGGWRDALAPTEVARLVRCHGDTMRLFGYVDEHGQPARV